MTWLLTDQQLAKLHQKFDMDECSSMENRLNVIREMNISAEIIHNWCQHMVSKFLSEHIAVSKKPFGENI